MLNSLGKRNQMGGLDAIPRGWRLPTHLTGDGRSRFPENLGGVSNGRLVKICPPLRLGQEWLVVEPRNPPLPRPSRPLNSLLRELPPGGPTDPGDSKPFLS